ncbi:MAG: 30S ribosomal protein S4 [Candidatus Berkelbacteria bacterium]|nr:30S ribosomal protein S4 [Candidatus Berkelbacteria bacterium]
METNCRECRKHGEKLFLKGSRCLSPMCGLARRQNAPGAPALKGKQQPRRRKKSEYGLQLQEKQKAKTEYGLREKQFSNIVSKASRAKEATGEAILVNLELRLDNCVYRLGFATSRTQARQLVNHGHVKVNDKIVDIPSYKLKEKDKIEAVNPEIIKNALSAKINPPSWLKLDKKTLVGEIESLPKREQIETSIDEQLVVEYYSR